jgi:mRNA interferase RelE/StbE
VSWDYEFDARALKELKKLGAQAQQQIVSYLDSRIAGKSGDPRRFGKPLTGDLKGLWRYRVADYRLICSIEEKRLIVLVLRVGHRRNVYD